MKRQATRLPSSEARSQSNQLMTKILIVEDEPSMVAGLRDNFEYEGYEVITAPDGVAGLERALNEAPDLVILDVMMPRMSGLDVCKQLKSKRPSVPIIMLTARGQEVDKVVGLELGADDYVTKPFSIRELLARVKAVLRRARTVPKEQDRYSFGDVEVNLRSCQVSRKGRALDFSSKEFELLKYFLCHPGETLSRDRLLEEVWGYERFPTTRTVDAHIVRLRQKVEPKAISLACLKSVQIWYSPSAISAARASPPGCGSPM